MWADVVRGWEGQKRGFSCIHTSQLHMPYAIAEHGLTLQTDCYLFASSARPSLIQIFIWIMTLCHTPLLPIHTQHWGEDTVSVAITDSVVVVVVVNNDQDVFFPAILSTSDVSPTTPLLTYDPPRTYTLNVPHDPLRRSSSEVPARDNRMPRDETTANTCL
jgi:hypothetical protein